MNIENAYNELLGVLKGVEVEGSRDPNLIYTSIASWGDWDYSDDYDYDCEGDCEDEMVLTEVSKIELDSIVKTIEKKFNVDIDIRVNETEKIDFYIKNKDIK